MRSHLILFFSVLSPDLFNSCHGQETPFFNISTLIPNVTVRQSFCDEYEEVRSGTLERRNALRGKQINVALFDYQIDGESGAINENPNSNIAVEFLDELAIRAGFEWRNSYGIIESPNENNNFTYEELLDWTVDTYDLMGEYYNRKPVRLEKGISFMESWFDGSLIMVAKEDRSDGSDVKWFSSFLPFTWQVWLFIVTLVIVSGIMYFLVDYLDSRGMSQKMEASLESQIFHASFIVTGHSLHAPSSLSTQIIAWSLGFTSLMLISIFTAKTASIIMTKDKPSLIINHISDAVKADLTICVWEGTSSSAYMNTFHENAKLLELKTQEECLESLVIDKCKMFVTYSSAWEEQKRDERYNKDCDLVWIGRPLNTQDAGFTLRDRISLCSSLFTDVLSLHMIEIKLDGTFERIWQSYYGSRATQDCETMINTSTKPMGVTLDQVGGLFFVHFVLCVIALVLSLVRCQLNDSEKKQSISREIKENVSNPRKLKKCVSSAFLFHQSQMNDSLTAEVSSNKQLSVEEGFDNTLSQKETCRSENTDDSKVRYETETNPHKLHMSKNNATKEYSIRRSLERTINNNDATLSQKETCLSENTDDPKIRYETETNPHKLHMSKNNATKEYSIRRSQERSINNNNATLEFQVLNAIHKIIQEYDATKKDN